MKNLLSLSVIAVGLAASFGHARADDITIDPVPFVSTASRAQVLADLQAYKASRVNPWATHYNPLAHFRGTRSRADVTAEFIAERESVAAMTGEDSGSSHLAADAARALQPLQLATRQ
jgi:hypothetical protein